MKLLCLAASMILLSACGPRTLIPEERHYNAAEAASVTPAPPDTSRINVATEGQPTDSGYPRNTWSLAREVCYKHVVYLIFPSGNFSVGGGAMMDPTTSKVVTC
jgi:hypothetical protein